MAGSEYIPVVNRPSTIYATTLVFLATAWIAVSLRLYVRFRLPISLGWDDLFVCFAIISCTAGSVIVCLQPNAGMGKHMAELPLHKLETYFSYVYAANVTYCSSTALIKIAILLQYLRLFDMGSKIARRICQVLIVITACWGLAFWLTALLGCMPIRANWDLSITDKKCVMFGSKDPKVLFAAFTGHATSNMFLDVLVLLTPIPFLKGLRMQGKTRWGIGALFLIGGIVTLFSIIRLASLATNRAGTYPVFDVTWYAPPIFIFSTLEVEVAILCASIPIFWPMIAKISFGKILVVNEIEVHSAPRDSALLELGTRSKHPLGDDDAKSKNGGAMSGMGGMLGRGRRRSDGSEERGLNPREESQGERHYADRYVAGWVAPDFDNEGRKPAHTTTAERAEIPFDHINALRGK